jgi:radical SAM superfamily enzyme YgiQ (UPF0313 family)
VRILLISTNRNRLPLPVMPIGACIVAHACEEAGHSVRLLDLMFARDARGAIGAALIGFKPDVVGISIRNIDNVDMHGPVFFLDDLQGIAATVRALSGARMVLGGAALGVMPEQILRLVPDVVAVVGDGELVLPLLLQRMARAEPLAGLPGVAYLEAGVLQRELSAVPSFSTTCRVPDYRRWLDTRAYRSQMATATLQTKLGCQFHCVYCTYPLIEGSCCRLKDPESVAQAVRRLAAAGFRDLEFVDSVFNAPHGHALEVCAALARVKHGARLQCLDLNPRDFDDELLDAMERAGFVGIGITLESASDPVLRGLRKGFTSLEVHQAAAVVRRHRIPCAWMFLLGGPGETRETVRETLRFAENEIRPGDVAFFNSGLRIYPGTGLELIARGEGVLSQRPDAMLAPVFYLSAEVDAGWMEEELKRSMDSHLNFIDIATLSLPFLPVVNKIGAALGMSPPHWRHTRVLRRVLRLAGMKI